ncbi:hypothetical protein DL767_000012 [Monosporascus sp. MG133]|nr:hypothetical protein DL767_000012 [Monosporascus sp. MG133]
MASFFTNNSCNPFMDPETPCTWGNYVRFAVNATLAADYQETIRFAEAHNVRLVIRHTGHDNNGKSTGARGLSLWTHNMKTKELKEYNGAGYSGKAFVFGAGILMQEAYEFAHSHGLLVVGANQPTVGFAGGYTQGGGHGPLASQFGLAADQVLEWEVVVASGDIVTASRMAHADLFWALCGGGGGTFGAVLSVTVRAHPPMTLSTASLAFVPPSGSPELATEDFYAAVGEFTMLVPSINDAGAVAAWFITAQSFGLSTLFGPGLEETELEQLLQPILKTLRRLNIEFSYHSETHSSFLEGVLRQQPVNVSGLNIGGRLIPRTLVETNNAELTATIRNITTAGALFSGVSFNVSQHAADSIGANPYWRESIFNAVVATPFNHTDWQANIRGVESITNDLLPPLEHLTPNGAAYLNEADFQQPDWQRVFYGVHFGKLSEIKSRYDPKDLFYVLGGVGSERWIQQADGRLCRT